MSYVRSEAVSDGSTRDRLERVIEAGQRMISSRFDLMSLELKRTVIDTLRMGFLTTFGALFLILGHLAGTVAAILGIALVLPAWAAVLIMAGVHFVLGGAALLAGIVLRPHAPRLAIEAEESQEAQRRIPGPVTGLPVRRPSTPMVYRPETS